LLSVIVGIGVRQPVLFVLPNKFTSCFLQEDTIGELRKEAGGANADAALPSARSQFHKYRGSVAWTEGFETNLHVLAKDQYTERALGVFTSGGDAQGSLKLLNS
jgi:hypothetical protein